MGSTTAGRKLTELLAKEMLDKWQKAQGVTFSNEERQSLTEFNFQAIDDTKRQLSALANRPNLNLTISQKTNLLPTDPSMHQYRPEISVEQFQGFALQIIQEAIGTIKSALAKAGLLESEIDSYFVVGGSSMLPLLDDELEKYFGKKAEPLIGDYGLIDKTLAISRGAAVYDLGLIGTTLERKLPYTISLVVDNRLNTKTLVPEGSILPFGPEIVEVYAPSTNDTLSFVLVRGEGHPDQCVELKPATISFIEPPKFNETVSVEVRVSYAGDLMVSAFDYKMRELGVIRIDQI